MMDKKQLETLIDDHRQRHLILREHTWASPAHKYLYMPVGKAACTKIKLSLYQLEGYPPLENGSYVHDRNRPGCAFVPSLTDFTNAQAIEILTSPEWFRFCFVRNPYYRLFSAYKSKMLNYLDPQYQAVRDEIRAKWDYPLRDGRPAGMVAFRDFVRYVEQQADPDRDFHWRSQAAIVMPDIIKYDLIGRMESFAQDFEQVLRRLNASAELIAAIPQAVNPTAKIYHAAAYDRELAGRVYEMYRQDFENFGYDRDSWLFDY
jgi:hypothetical protein